MPPYWRTLRLSGALSLAIPTMVLAQPSALGTFTTFNFPGAGYTQARYIASSGEIVGFYFEGPAFASPAHGLLRSKDGELSPIDFPGTQGTTWRPASTRKVTS
jgi:hypothetical protein